ncbi:MAG: DUF1080 domain-containing protein [Pseudomonadota bacterium]
MLALVLLLPPLGYGAAEEATAGAAQAGSLTESEAGWIELFNGENLEGWIAKITGHPLGENFADTFRVEDGLLQVRYDGYEYFDGRFGHLFWKTPYSHYRLQIEYRFHGEQVRGGPAWAARNSGVMVHAQAPDAMSLKQEFPVSIEAQFLGGLDDGKPRPTANLCTPGTDVMHAGSLYTPHCLTSSSETFPGDQWVLAEIIVRGSGTITHRINGEVVLEYEAPRLSDRGDHQLTGEPTLLTEGYLALQSESHPVDFRRVRIKLLQE